MERFSIREVIDQAVQTERLGYQFYTTMAENLRRDEGLAKLFSNLAAKEQRHEKTFSELAGIIRDDEPENWEEAEQYLRAIVESEFFLGKNKSLPSLAHVKTVEDAVNFALGFEKETLLYFYGIRDAVKEREIVDEIINEERSHIMWLNRFKGSFKK
ncbi:MAG TPA: ferritin family protein [Thermodesulfovibrionales bacterium]|nr:ferritin family protein [Thermodesulfovibrionales bacterium]